MAWLNLLKVLNFSELEESLLVLRNTSSVFVMFHGTVPEKQYREPTDFSEKPNFQSLLIL
jgi:hypothetical protein